MLALASLSYGIIEGDALVYGTPEILTLFAVCLASLAAFLVAQAKGKHPMIPLDLFRSRAVSTAGVGLTLFQQIIPRPGLASGLFTNTRRLGAIASGPIIAIGSMTAFGYQGVFAACAILTAVALVIIELTAKTRKQQRSQAERRIPAHQTEAP